MCAVDGIIIQHYKVVMNFLDFAYEQVFHCGRNSRTDGYGLDPEELLPFDPKARTFRTMGVSFSLMQIEPKMAHGRKLGYNTLPEKMRELGFLPANVYELLWFGYQNKGLQLERNIIAIGSSKGWAEDRVCPYLGKNVEGKRIISGFLAYSLHLPSAGSYSALMVREDEVVK